MIINNIELYNYRKFDKINLRFDKGINLIVGQNGTGKTTIIESIGVGLFGESFNNVNLNNIIKINSKNCWVKIHIINSKSYEVIRKINNVNNKINQSLSLNDKSLSQQELLFNLKFLKKKLYFDFCIIKNFDYVLENINKIAFQEELSDFIISWNIINILDSLKENIKTYKNMENKYKFTLDNYMIELKQLERIPIILNELNSLKNNLNKKLAESEIKINILNLERQKILESKNRKYIGIEDLKQIENTLKHLDILIENIKVKYDLKNNSLNNDKVILDKIFKKIKLFENDIKNLFEEYSSISINEDINMINIQKFKLNDIENEINKKNEYEYKLMSAIKEINQYNNQIEKYNTINKKTSFIYEEIKSIEKMLIILNNIYVIINQTWEEILYTFILNVSQKINFYLKLLDSNYKVIFFGNKLKIKTENSILEMLNLS